MYLSDLLFSQGFGTRRICAGLVQQGLVKDRYRQWPATDGRGPRNHPHRTACLTKCRAYFGNSTPRPTSCCTNRQVPSARTSPLCGPVSTACLPAPLRQRPAKTGLQGVQAVGRLDQDTTGMLLLSDDGQFIHRMSSPKHHVPKLYELTTADALDDKVCQKLLAGVLLNDDPQPVKAAACEQVGTHQLHLTLTEGKYHQVKRMLGAVGHKVVGLHRSRIGGLVLPADLAPGQWRWLGPHELAQCSA
jgi:16S rRNA pseudouridine516 synthase